MRKVLAAIFSIVLFASHAQAQAAEVTVSLNEAFFDALLDAVFKNLNAPEFPLAQASPKFKVQSSKPAVLGFNEINSAFRICSETIRLRREIAGVRTAVRFRDGKIYAPIAFDGSYNPPLVGCIDFQGWAETFVNLEYDRKNQKLVGKIQVANVQLSGTGGMGSGLITKFVQNSIDRRVNPLEILPADKLSFIVPVQNAGGSLKMKATGIGYEIANGVLNVRIGYEFSKGN